MLLVYSIILPLEHWGMRGQLPQQIADCVIKLATNIFIWRHFFPSSLDLHRILKHIPIEQHYRSKTCPVREIDDNEVNLGHE